MFDNARPFLLALAIGLLIGVERERAHADRRTHEPLGSRTFTLLALLGALAAHVESVPLSVTFAAFAGALVIAGYLRTPLGPDGSGVGATTEVAAIVTFALGFLAHRDAALTVMLAVITMVMLALKPRIHHFARAGMTASEVRAALAFLVIAFVLLPILPDRPLDPWGVVNPFRLWLLFALIAGIGFAGYIAVRLLGPERGFAVAGLFAGFVSSTAATVAFSQRGREDPSLAGVLVPGIVLANSASATAQLVVVAVAAPQLFSVAFPVIAAPAVVGAAAGLLAERYAAASAKASPLPSTSTLANPLALKQAAGFALAMGVALAASSALGRWFGTAGILAGAAVGGAADVHAVTLAVATLQTAGSLSARDAVLAMTVAFACNMVVKLAVVGGAGGVRLLARVAPPLVLMTAAALTAFLLGGVR